MWGNIEQLEKEGEGGFSVAKLLRVKITQLRDSHAAILKHCIHDLNHALHL